MGPTSGESNPKAVAKVTLGGPTIWIQDKKPQGWGLFPQIKGL